MQKIEEYKFSYVFGGRKALLASQGQIIMAELDNTIQNLTHKQVKIEEKDISLFLDTINRSIEDIEAKKDVPAYPIQKKDMHRKTTLYLACLSAGVYNAVNLVHFRNYVRHEGETKFIATRAGMTVKADEADDQWVDFIERLEEAIMTASNMPSWAPKKVLEEATEIIARNPAMDYSDIGRITNHTLRTNSKMFPLRQVVANIIAAREIKERVFSYQETKQERADNGGFDILTQPLEI